MQSSVGRRGFDKRSVATTKPFNQSGEIMYIRGKMLQIESDRVDFVSSERINGAVSINRVLRVLPLAAALMIASQAMAQSTSDDAAEQKRVEAKTLDSVEVVGQAVQRATNIGRIERPLREIPQSVTVMDAGRIEDQNLRSLDDVLQHTPGIILGADSSIENTYYARGHVISSIQYDAMATRTSAEIVASPNMAMFEAVEVLRGSNGVLNGINGFGSINMRRKRALDYFQLNTGVSVGQWDRYHFDIDVAGPIDDAGKFRGRFVAAYDDKHYFYPFADFRETLLYGTLEVDLSEKTTLRLATHWQDTMAHPNTPGVPYYTDGGDIGLPRSTMLSPDWSVFAYDTKNLFVELNHQLERDWSAKLMVNFLDTKSYNDYAYYWGGVNRATGAAGRFYGEQLDTGMDQFQTDFTLQGPLRMWGRDHQVLVGITRQITHVPYYYADTSSYLPVGLTLSDIVNFDPTSLPRPPKLAPTWYWPDEFTAQTGVFGQIALKPTDNLTLMLGVRVDWWKFFDIGYDTNGNEDERSQYSIEKEVTPLVGATWNFSRNWSAYASFTDYLIPQNVRNSAGELLDPRRATNYEVGVKGELFEKRLIASVAVFRLEEINRPMLEFPDAEPIPGRPVPYIASGETRSDGAELELNGLITKSWSMNFGYTYNTTEFTNADANVGRPFATYTPRHIAKLWSNYRFPFLDGRLSAGVSVVAQSPVERPILNFAAYLEKDGYAVVDLALSYLLNENWRLGMNLNNILDKTYYAGSVGSSAAGNHFYGEPRNVMFTLRGKF